MIQRIQTLFLLLALAGYVLLFFFPIASFFSEMAYYKLYVTEIRNMGIDENQFSRYMILPMLIVLSLIIVLVVVSILRYRNRLYQIRLNKISILLTVFLIAGIFYFYPNRIENRIGAGADFEIGAYFPLASLLFLILANRFILKDEKLIRSIDRIR